MVKYLTSNNTYQNVYVWVIIILLNALVYFRSDQMLLQSILLDKNDHFSDCGCVYINHQETCDCTVWLSPILNSNQIDRWFFYDMLVWCDFFGSMDRFLLRPEKFRLLQGYSLIMWLWISIILIIDSAVVSIQWPRDPLTFF